MSPEELAVTTFWTIDDWREAQEILGEHWEAMQQLVADFGDNPAVVAFALVRALEEPVEPLQVYRESP